MTTAIDADTTADRSRTGDAPRRRGARKRRAGLIVAIVAYLVTFLIILPLLWIVLLSFQPSGNILSNPFSFANLTFDNYVNAIASLPLLRMYGNTILIAVVSVFVGTAISFMAAKVSLFAPFRMGLLSLMASTAALAVSTSLVSMMTVRSPMAAAFLQSSTNFALSPASWTKTHSTISRSPMRS